jgi:hypothetical protein
MAAPGQSLVNFKQVSRTNGGIKRTETGLVKLRNWRHEKFEWRGCYYLVQHAHTRAILQRSGQVTYVMFSMLYYWQWVKLGKKPYFRTTQPTDSECYFVQICHHMTTKERSGVNIRKAILDLQTSFHFPVHYIGNIRFENWSVCCSSWPWKFAVFLSIPRLKK